jgi:hypothetical protein
MTAETPTQDYGGLSYPMPCPCPLGPDCVPYPGGRLAVIVPDDYDGDGYEAYRAGWCYCQAHAPPRPRRVSMSKVGTCAVEPEARQ